MNQIHPVIIKYIEAWVNKDQASFLGTLHEDFYCKECTGDVYEGIDQSARWFLGWHSGDNRVLSWAIKQGWQSGDHWFLTWTFKCRFEDEDDTFDGMSHIFMSGDKIREINEYSQVHEVSYPYGRT